jgi:hypothetical protein
MFRESEEKGRRIIKSIFWLLHEIGHWKSFLFSFECCNFLGTRQISLKQLKKTFLKSKSKQQHSKKRKVYVKSIVNRNRVCYQQVNAIFTLLSSQLKQEINQKKSLRQIGIP